MQNTPINSRDLSALTPAFRWKAEYVLKACADKGVKMVPYSAVRDPWEQARLWRRSRTTAEVFSKIQELQDVGANFLASCISDVGPQSGTVGAHVTGAIPGLSWHNWSEALDCYWEVGGKAVWSLTQGGNKNGYKVYAEEAKAHLLFSGGKEWGADWPHIHASSLSSPSKMGLPDIDNHMRNLYGSFSIS